MINVKKIQYVAILILACTFMPVFAAEPNEPNLPNFKKTELKFENIDKAVAWETRGIKNTGHIKPTFDAQMMLSSLSPLTEDITSIMNRILESPISKRFSKEHQEFLKSELAIETYSVPGLQQYSFISLYATSQEDAKLMAQALIDTLNTRAEQALAEIKQEINQWRQELDKAQKELPGIHKQLEDAEKQYKNVKDTTHPYSSDNEAEEMAKKSIIEMDKELNALDIELAGIRERLKAIEKYKTEPQRVEINYKLDQMYIELTIELSGLQARKDMTEKIRQKEQAFLGMYVNRTDLIIKINNIRGVIENRQIMILDTLNRLKDTTIRPEARWQPPKVYQNTVTIYPVLTDN